MPTAEEEFVIGVYYQYLFKLTDAAFGNAPHPVAALQGYEEWARQSGRVRNLQEVRDKFMKPANSFIDANGNVQWGTTGPTMGMNGSGHM